jgi:hypothetical protein
VIGRIAGLFGGTIIKRTERRTITQSVVPVFSADRRGIAVGVTRSGPFLSTGDNADCPAHYLKLGHWGSKQARLCAQFGSTANVRFWHKADMD